jgi:hypothetical protein
LTSLIARELLIVARLLTGTDTGSWHMGKVVVESNTERAILRITQSAITQAPVYDPNEALAGLNSLLKSIRNLVGGLNGSIRILSDKSLFRGLSRELIVEVKRPGRVADLLSGLESFGFKSPRD